MGCHCHTWSVWGVQCWTATHVPVLGVTRSKTKPSVYVLFVLLRSMACTCSTFLLYIWCCTIAALTLTYYEVSKIICQLHLLFKLHALALSDLTSCWAEQERGEETCHLEIRPLSSHAGEEMQEAHSHGPLPAVRLSKFSPKGRPTAQQCKEEILDSGPKLSALIRSPYRPCHNLLLTS